jgi:hypothetical protein
MKHWQWILFDESGVVEWICDEAIVAEFIVPKSGGQMTLLCSNSGGAHSTSVVWSNEERQ